MKQSKTSSQNWPRTLILSGVLRISITGEALRGGEQYQVLLHWPLKGSPGNSDLFAAFSANGV